MNVFDPALWLIKRWGAIVGRIADAVDAANKTGERQLTLNGILRRLLYRFRDFDQCVAYIDENGYTPAIVKVLLEEHFIKIAKSPAGSDAHCIYLDLYTALTQYHIFDGLHPMTRAITIASAELSTKQMDAKFQVSSSRILYSGCEAISNYLEGKL